MPVQVDTTVDTDRPVTPVSAAAARALAEAEARRAAAVKTVGPDEIGGRDGPDPVRFGDWEVRGLASDF